MRIVIDPSRLALKDLSSPPGKRRLAQRSTGLQNKGGRGTPQPPFVRAPIERPPRPGPKARSIQPNRNRPSTEC